MAGRSCRGTTGGATAARPPSGAGTEAGGFECNHPSRLAQFDAQLMMVAHDHDVPSTAGPRLQAGRDRFDQIHDRIAHHYSIVFTQVSHIDRPRFVPRPSDQLLNFGCVGHGGSPCLLALILCCHRSSLSSPFPPSRNARERKSRCCSDPTGCERRVPLGRPPTLRLAQNEQRLLVEAEKRGGSAQRAVVPDELFLSAHKFEDMTEPRT